MRKCDNPEIKKIKKRRIEKKYILESLTTALVK